MNPSKMCRKINNAGFTIIELLIVIGIISIMSGTAALSFLSIQSSNEREVTVQEIVSILRKNQSLAMSGEKQSEFGVHFENDKYTEFEGVVYTAGADGNIEHPLTPGVSIQNINFPGVSEVSFARLTGKVSVAGSIDLGVIGIGGISRITINELGTVNVQKID